MLLRRRAGLPARRCWCCVFSPVSCGEADRCLSGFWLEAGWITASSGAEADRLFRNLAFGVAGVSVAK